MAKAPERLFERAHLKALLKLSEFRRGVTAGELESLTRTSPDPATVFAAVSEELLSDSPALVAKWRKTLPALWAHHHPDIPSLPDIPLTKQQATSTFVLLDALSFLDSLTHKPARLIHRGGQTLLHPQDIPRLLKRLDSFEGETPSRGGSEWDVPALKRLRDLLSAVRLLRNHKGELQVVRSRLKTFLRLPRSYQYFVLWHADVYHVCWGEYAPDWHDELRVIQDYVPLLWELAEDARAGEVVDKQVWCLSLIEIFAPLWAEQGLLQTPVRLSLSRFFHESALPIVINQVLINDLLARYGLIQFEHDGNFVWTPLGITLAAAEINHTLPCGVELLD